MPISVKFKFHFDKRQLNRLARNISKMKKKTLPILMSSSKTFLSQIRTKAQEIIIQETEGTGNLANSMIISSVKKGKNSGLQSLEFVGRAKKYAAFVHNSFQAHFVHKSMIKDWLALHPNVHLINNEWLEVGRKKTTRRRNGQFRANAKWVSKGGVKFLTRAIKQFEGTAQTTLFDDVQKFYKRLMKK